MVQYENEMSKEPTSRSKRKKRPKSRKTQTEAVKRLSHVCGGVLKSNPAHKEEASIGGEKFAILFVSH